MSDYNTNVLFVTALHTREIYERLRFYSEYTAGRIQKGEAVYRDIIAEMPTITAIIRTAKKHHIAGGGEVWWGKEYEKEARKATAEYVLSEAAGIINNEK